MALKSLFLEVLTVLRADRHDEGFYHSTFLDTGKRVMWKREISLKGDDLRPKNDLSHFVT